jgi:hypothetical protein
MSFLILLILFFPPLLNGEESVLYQKQSYLLCETKDPLKLDSEGNFLKGCLEGEFHYLFAGQIIELDRIYSAGTHGNLFSARVKAPTKLKFGAKSFIIKEQTTISFYPNGQLAEANFLTMNYYFILGQKIEIIGPTQYSPSGKLKATTLATEAMLSCDGKEFIHISKGSLIQLLESGLFVVRDTFHEQCI